MNIDYGAISAWAAIVAALTAVFAIWVEGKRARFAQGLDILYRMKDDFDNESFKQKRRTIAKILLRENTPKKNKKDQSIPSTIGTDILDHFQAVGMLLRRRILDEELVYSEYFFWVEGYWICLQKTFSEFREKDITVWEDAYWLYKRLKRFERNLPPKGVDIPLTDDDMKYFLKYESTLV